MEDQEGFIWIGTANGMLDQLDPNHRSISAFPIGNRGSGQSIENSNPVDGARIGMG